MSRDSSGNFNLPAGNPVIGGTPIEAGWANPTMSDIAAGLTDSLSRSGKGGMAAPLVMNGYRVTSIGPASAPLGTDAPQAVQVRDTAFNRLDTAVSDGGGNNYTASSSLTAAPVNGTLYLFIADKNNTGPMTMSVNNGASIPIVINGDPIPPGIVLSGAVIGIMFINGSWRVTNTAGATGTINLVQSDNIDIISVTNNLPTATATLNIHPNVPRGLAQLDSNAKIPVAQMPFTTLEFIGNWNASSGALPPAAANGSVYLIVGAGTLSLFRPDAPGSNNYTAQATPVVINDQILYKTPATTGQPVGWYYSPAPSGTATAANVSMVATPNPPFAGITNVQTWLNAADPAITGKLNKAGGALTGDVTQAAAPAGATSLITAQYVINAINGIPPGVDSFNGLTGDVVLTSAHVTVALGYTPVNPATPVFSVPVTAPAFTATGFFTGKGFSQNTPAAVAATTTVDYVNGQSQIFTLSGALAITAVSNIPRGSVLRLTFFNYASIGLVTWPATVNWPLGAAPDLSLGPLKKAIVVLENDGAVLLATSAAY